MTDPTPPSAKELIGWELKMARDELPLSPDEGMRLLAAYRAVQQENERLKRTENRDNIDARLKQLGLQFAISAAGLGLKSNESLGPRLETLRDEFQAAAFWAFCDLGLPYLRRAEEAEAKLARLAP